MSAHERRNRTWRVSGALLAPVVLAGVLVAVRSPAGAANSVIGFDDLAVGTVVDHQYHGLGVDFGPPGLQPVVQDVGPNEAQSGSHVADISVCNCSAPHAAEATGTLTAAQRQITVFVGAFDAGPSAAQVTLTAFDNAHNQVAQSAPATASVGAGFHTYMAVSSPAATITSFTIASRPGADNGKRIGIDDLSFGSPPTGPTPGTPPGLSTPGSSGAGAAAAPGSSNGLSPLTTAGAAAVSRPRLQLPRQASGSVSLLTPTETHDHRVVTRFQLSASARVRLTVRVPGRPKPLVTLHVSGTKGMNRVVLSSSASKALKHGGATIRVDARAPRGGATGTISIGVGTGSPESNGPAPNEFGLPQQTLATFPSSIVAIAAYFAPSDAGHHVIVATQDGRVTELVFGNLRCIPENPAPCVEQNLLGHFFAPIAGVAGYDAQNDGFQHVFIGFHNGTVLEDYWAKDHKIQQDTPIFSPGGIDHISAFTAPVSGWNQWPQWVVITRVANGLQRTFATLLKSPNIEPFSLPKPTADAAFYSAYGGPALLNRYQPEFAPFSLYDGPNVGLQWGGILDGLGGDPSSPLTAYEQTGKAPDLDHIVHTDGSDVMELHPAVQGDPDCQSQSQLPFYPDPNRRDNVQVNAWCTNQRARFSGSIAALAGYFAAGDSRQHIVVATNYNPNTATTKNQHPGSSPGGTVSTSSAGEIDEVSFPFVPAQVCLGNNC